MSERVRVDLYLQTQAGCSCGHSCGPSAGRDTVEETNRKLREIGNAVKERMGEKADVHVEDYSSTESILSAMEALNRALVKGKVDFVITPANFFAFTTSVSPIVVVDDNVYSTKRLPSKDKLMAYVAEANR